MGPLTGKVCGVQSAPPGRGGVIVTEIRDKEKVFALTVLTNSKATRGTFATRGKGDALAGTVIGKIEAASAFYALSRVVVYGGGFDERS